MKALQEARRALALEAEKYLKVVRLIDELDQIQAAKAAVVNTVTSFIGKGKKRHFSAAAREKMRLAQKKRWAKWHREQGAKHRG